jgi:hypothetical protein
MKSETLSVFVRERLPTTLQGVAGVFGNIG